LTVDAVIEVDGLRKTYGTTVAVDDLSFSVGRGEIFGILGPNGAGKTTTVESLAGLRRPDRGRVRVLGLDPQAQGRELRQRIGLQLQQAALPERIRVREAVELFASFYRRPLDGTELLERWGLADKGNAAFASLSGGQRQRLFIALALVGDPELVILDELTAGLDPQARRVTWELVAAIRAAGTTVVLVTHLMDEAERLCDRVAIIDEGRIVAQGTPAELIRPLATGAQVRFSATNEFDAAWMEGVAGVTRVVREDEQIVVHGSGPLLARVATALAEREVPLADLRAEQHTLEDVFLAVTGRRLRD